LNRLGAILIPLLVGFLATVAIVSWRSGWCWQRDSLKSPMLAVPSVEVRRSRLRVVQVEVSAAPPPGTATAPAVTVAAKPEVQPLISEPPEPLAVPRANPGNSQLEAPVRKFARGSTDRD
jgi:hypothetical protein